MVVMGDARDASCCRIEYMHIVTGDPSSSYSL